MSEFEPGDIWVVKVGSSLLTNNGMGVDRSLVQGWADQIAELRARSIRVVLVSSGAVAEGMQRLGIKARPHSLHELQAAAAVGQMGLIQMYESAFQRHDIHTAQILLTHDDLKSRERYLNARSTLTQLLDLGVVPIVNENDTVVTDEIQFGDNDTLAALVVNLIGADTLLLLTDQPGLMSANPTMNPDAELIKTKPAGAVELDDMAGEGSALGRGGMVTKIRAARTAARSGAKTVIASGREQEVMRRLSQSDVTGTLLTPDRESVVARKQWLASLPTRGYLTLDEGACRVLKGEGRSLLSVGVTKTRGSYTRGDVVSCLDGDDREIARGLINYGNEDVVRILGVSSDQIESVLGYLAEEELIHRDNLVLL
ncbi:MAG: glutamate 5-kinase [Pseudomonadales bacterium]|nr:glutamate 5-kinase [Pseudomonadales bacterium]MBO6597985.1 glutamate 5-kinase [Pseudomonadales bacterium]MBO6658906.1 glutamate 5-kinase [Pseudomonadales bacterium]MBO6704136.1 glutamate 5-kinase [Pseudomonadales bacterium]MBO6822993.1 glutamate 5-kinase [Pseudomonadales bacterium]